MREYDNSKIHISSNFLLSICLIIMLDTLLLLPPLHCNTSPHFAKLHFTTLIDTLLPLIYTSLHSHLAEPIYISYRSVPPHITKLDTVQLSHPQTYFQNNEPLHCPKEPLTISLFFFFFYLSSHFTLLFTSTTRFPSLHFSSLFTFYRLHFPTVLHFPNPHFENMSFTMGSPYSPFR